jgi:K+-transporting ATPase A subunit
MSNNNGSAFGGAHRHQPFYTIVGGIAMLFSRYWCCHPSPGGRRLTGPAKKRVPESVGTFPTHTILFVLLLVRDGSPGWARSRTCPGLALGPIVEH